MRRERNAHQPPVFPMLLLLPCSSATLPGRSARLPEHDRPAHHARSLLIYQARLSICPVRLPDYPTVPCCMSVRQSSVWYVAQSPTHLQFTPWRLQFIPLASPVYPWRLQSPWRPQFTPGVPSLPLALPVYPWCLQLTPDVPSLPLTSPVYPLASPVYPWRPQFTPGVPSLPLASPVYPWCLQFTPDVPSLPPGVSSLSWRP